MKKQNLFQRSLFLFSLLIILNSCNSFNQEQAIKEIETCLGTYKKLDDLIKMSKSERIEISKCILPHLKDLEDQGKELSDEERSEAIIKFNEILDKSEYKEIIKTMNYEGVMRFLDENDENVEKVANEAMNEAENLVNKEAEKAEEAIGYSQSEMSEEEQAEQGEGEPSGEIVVGISERIYFYTDSNFESKTSSYFVKGQKAEYFDVSDDNVDDEFLYVNFEYNGKIKSGYVLKSDVEFQ